MDIIITATIAASISIIYLGFGFFGLYKVGWKAMDSYEKGQILKLILSAPIIAFIAILIFIKKPTIEPNFFLILGAICGLFGLGILINDKFRSKIDTTLEALFKPAQPWLAANFILDAILFFILAIFKY